MKLRVSAVQNHLPTIQNFDCYTLFVKEVQLRHSEIDE